MSIYIQAFNALQSSSVSHLTLSYCTYVYYVASGCNICQQLVMNEYDLLLHVKVIDSTLTLKCVKGSLIFDSILGHVVYTSVYMESPSLILFRIQKPREQKRFSSIKGITVPRLVRIRMYRM